MSIFNRWFIIKKTSNANANLWLLTEKALERQNAEDVFCDAVRSHYDNLKMIASDVANLGFEKASEILKERLPTTAKAKSGELGEIMATEFAEQKLGFKIPVKRIRYKDGRNMALRGDDFIGILYSKTDDKLTLLKGESKSNNNLGKTVIEEARAVLNRDEGRCTPISLLFVADRLFEGTPEEQRIGQKLRNEVVNKAIAPANIHHAFFTLTGNDPTTILQEDLAAAPTNRTQNVINIRITDHQNFIKETYEKIAKLGNT